MEKPYVGVAGFTKKSEIESAIDAIPENFSGLLAVGLLATFKTFFERAGKMKNSKRYPRREEINNLLVRHPKVLNLIHYYTPHTGGLRSQLVVMTEKCGESLHGFQLNLCWPEISELEKYKISFPDKKIVLQAGREALKKIKHSHNTLVSLAKSYEGIVDYLLLDMSGGEGVPLDVFKMTRYLLSLRHAGIDMNFGVAGGLGPDTLYFVEPIIREYPGISIDAKSKLRDDNDEMSLALVVDYIKRASLLPGFA